FIIGHMGLFFYTQKGSIISTVVLPTTEIIEPKKEGCPLFLYVVCYARAPIGSHGARTCG
ncbi:hypothetical protein F6P60_03625, partial [Streptococcus suis]|nr:hypothetical protein [Streptococcus suis]